MNQPGYPSLPVTKDPDKLRAYEARAWRLAFLLTGDGAGAGELVHRVLKMQPNVLDLEPQRLDRLVVLQSREWAARRRCDTPAQMAQPPEPTGPAAAAATAMHELARQPLEAWVLARIDEVDEMWMARAMDSSKKAASMHLKAADEVMRDKLGDSLEEATKALRVHADSIDPAPFIQAAHARRKQQRRKNLFIAIAGGAALIALILIMLRAVLGGGP
jgi:hypothetical protein